MSDSNDHLPAPPTVVYIHGVGNKVAPPLLKQQWDFALFGRDMGDRTRMAYWADIRYAAPLGQMQPGPTPASVPEGFDLSDEQLVQQNRALAPPAGADFAEQTTRALLGKAKETEQALAQSRMTTGTLSTDGASAAAVDASLLPSPLRGWLTAPLLKEFVPDAAAYFFNPSQRAAIQARLRSILQNGAGPFLIVAHSLGSVIAYDLLCELEASGKEVPLFLSAGSPLGIAEIQDQIAKPLRIPSLIRRWRNVFDRLDFIALDLRLAPGFPPGAGRPAVEDMVVVNPSDLQLDPHAIEGYLRTGAVRDAVRELVGHAFANPLGDFVMARDLAAEVTGSLDRRLPALIELGEALPGGSLDEKRRRIVAELEQIVGPDRDEAGIDALRRYVAVNLTPPQMELLLSRHPHLQFERVWKNNQKTALLDQSIRTIQAATAHSAYGATGKGIAWAILDTGIRADHPHFARLGNIKLMWDCTASGDPRPGIGPDGALGGPAAAPPPAAVPPPAGEGATDAAVPAAPAGPPANPFRDDRGQPWGTDRNGHGTHVAGIIAGVSPEAPAGPAGASYRGIAPEAELHIYKVLDDQGHGQDSAIIKALDHILERNDAAPAMAIQGINLSLGGSFDPTVFQCGFSPICREVRRLWRQGVVVCIAAGNAGRVLVLDAERRPLALSPDLSIGDPANLEEAIAVGSVHKASPHLFGVSYFSSRGPTADGRQKPDVVAPGEEVISCNAWYGDNGIPPLYVPMSGTSMACPHVSGLIAAFLSARREFIGYPERVKEILKAHCTDMGRVSNQQGAGLPNLMKMLTDT